MGRKGNRAGVPRAFVLDAAALIALERDSRRFRLTLRGAFARDAEVVVPASVLAQVWRGGPRSARLAKFVAQREVDALDERRAKEIGKRIGSRDGSDVVDAHVVCCAVEQKALIVTSDAGDMQALAEPDESLGLIAI